MMLANRRRKQKAPYLINEGASKKMKELIIWIDYTDETKKEYMVKFDDPVINKQSRFTQYSKEAVNQELSRIFKRYKVESFHLFDTTNV